MPAGLMHHVLNRTLAGLPLFRKESDSEAFKMSIGRPTRSAYTALVAQITTASQIMDGLKC